MSFIKTMKGQAVEAGAAIINWPADSLNIFFMPCDDGDGNSAIDAITEDEMTSSIATLGNTANNHADFAFTFASVTSELTSMRNPDSDSFVLFCVADTPATGIMIQLGTTGGAGYMTMQVQPNLASVMKDSNEVTLGAANTVTASQSNQLVMMVVDRENGELRHYDGTNGDNLKLTQTISNTAAMNCDLDIDGTALGNCYGFGAIRFPNGIPDNFASLMLHIATELRAGRKLTWLNNFVDDFIL